MYIKLDPADIAFSRYIRLRDDFTCQRCLKEYDEKAQGLHNSHYFGRGSENTRFDPENCDSLCWGCHQFWGSQDKEAYRDFKIRQLGQKGFDDLVVRSKLKCKKDRKLVAIVWRREYKLLKDKKYLKGLGL